VRLDGRLGLTLRTLNRSEYGRLTPKPAQALRPTLAARDTFPNHTFGLLPPIKRNVRITARRATCDARLDEWSRCAQPESPKEGVEGD
jgi:hypothetical protein